MDTLARAYTNYAEFKATLDAELTRTTEGFVRIGYLLKIARDNPDVLSGSGYANINDMAAAEYNIDKTMVSRFININDRFSEGGYSDHLQEKYKGYGYAKLAIMLQLPDEINDEISPDYSKSEINTIKKEYDAEQEITPLEVIAEAKDTTVTTIEKGNEPLTDEEKVIYVLMHNEPDLYKQLWNSSPEWKKYREILAPAGDSMYIARVSGLGKFMISIKESSDSIAIVNMRDTSSRQQVSEREFMNICQKMLAHDEPTADAKWKSIFKEEMIKTEIAPVQQEPEKKAPDKKPEKKAAVKKQKVRVSDTKPADHTKTAKKEKTEISPIIERTTDDKLSDAILAAKMEVIGYFDDEWKKFAQIYKEEADDSIRTAMNLLAKMIGNVKKRVAIIMEEHNGQENG